MSSLDYPSYSAAREHLKDVFDAAGSGHVVSVARGKESFAIMTIEQLRTHLAATVLARLRVGKAEDTGTWVASMDGRPFIAEGDDADDAIDALVEELQEYSDDFDEHFALASNHRDNWALAHLILFSTADQLNDWLRA